MSEIKPGGKASRKSAGFKMPQREGRAPFTVSYAHSKAGPILNAEFETKGAALAFLAEIRVEGYRGLINMRDGACLVRIPAGCES